MGLPRYNRDMSHYFIILNFLIMLPQVLHHLLKSIASSSIKGVLQKTKEFVVTVCFHWTQLRISSFLAHNDKNNRFYNIRHFIIIRQMRREMQRDSETLFSKDDGQIDCIS